MSDISKTRMSVAEYLAAERALEWRHEFFDGVMTPRVHPSYLHSLIVTNLGSTLSTALRDTPAEAHIAAMRIKVETIDFYAYPDALVVRHPPLLEDSHADTLLNPVLLVEVFSDATEAFDRGARFQRYRCLPSLEEYMLVSQNTPYCESYLRIAPDEWEFREFRGLGNSMLLRSFNVELPLTRIYRDVPPHESERPVPINV